MQIYIPRKRLFWAVSLGHFTNDLFMQAGGAVLLAFLSATVLPMSNTQIGFAVSAKQLLSAITQPFFGIRADHSGGRGIGAAANAWVGLLFVVSVLLAVMTRNYWLMLIPYVLQGLGSGAVHPVGALHAVEADHDHAASSTAYFFLMGQAGLALGPGLMGLLLDLAHSSSLIPFATLPGFPGIGNIGINIFPILLLGFAAVPGVLLMYTSVPAGRRQKAKPIQQAAAADELPDDAQGTSSVKMAAWLPFIVIGLLVILRSLASPGSVNFIPVLFQQKGWSPAQYGLITSFFWLASGIAGVVFGNLADRIDRRLVMMGSMVLSAPAFFFLPFVDGAGAFVLAVLAGGLSGGAHSIIVVLAQELLPDSKGFASGAILGFIFGTGALGSLVIGAVSDTIGLGLTFQIVAVAAAVSGLFSLLLPKQER